MISPRLTFFCELATGPLEELFAAPETLATLRALGAGVSLGLLDLSPERAGIVRHLNAAGVPVTAWLLLPEADGYWFNADNAPQAAQRYGAFRAWTLEHGLQWERVGLDIEPDLRLLREVLSGKAGAWFTLARRACDRDRLPRAAAAYAALAARIRADGFPVESYHLPFIVDERRAGSLLLRRLLGLVEVETDREVLMLYSSLFGVRGGGFLWSYAADADQIAVGSVGGGVALPGGGPPLDWAGFSRDLRLAWLWKQELYIFSLEGCARQGFLSRLPNFDWAATPPSPLDAARRVDLLRGGLRAGLRLSRYPLPVLAGLAAGSWLLWHVRRARNA